jgi:glycosyltransferase involved in cell wall biosynthesis
MGKTAIGWNQIYQFLMERQFGPNTAEASAARSGVDKAASRRDLVEIINGRDQVSAVFVPHYYHFPEATLLERHIVFYVPDYMPHFYPNVPFEGTLERDQENAGIGRKIGERAKVVLTNAAFTRAYLPKSSLRIASAKIRLAPMPLLTGKLPSISYEDRLNLEDLMHGRRFIFYPTANRPNKELAFLLRVFYELRYEWPELRLALTCSLSDYPPVAEAARSLNLIVGEGVGDVILFRGAHEGTVRWLYENAAALSFTSTMEGNFPPQVIEALHYDTPVVATRLPQIEEVLVEETESLLICSICKTKAG